jgi:fumarylacetoacetase
MLIDATHDPALQSWVDSANDAGTDFPIQNLPFGRFCRSGSGEPWRIGGAIGTQVLDLKLAAAAVAWPAEIGPLLEPLAAGELNRFMARSAADRRRLRAALSSALRAGSALQQAWRAAWWRSATSR